MTLPHYENGADLRDYLNAAQDEFEAARRWHWAQDDAAAHLAAADLTGRQIVDAAFTLADPTPHSSYPEIPWEAHQAFAKSEKGRGEVAEAVQLALANELHEDLARMSERCLELAEQVFGDPPGPEVSKFLRRLTRCYVAGFLPECVILCRAVLENAVRELYERRRLPLPATTEGQSTMRMRLDSAKTLGLLSESAVRDSLTIWARGNKAVHWDIEATSDVLGTVRLTLGVLAEIYA